METSSNPGNLSHSLALVWADFSLPIRWGVPKVPQKAPGDWIGWLSQAFKPNLGGGRGGKTGDSKEAGPGQVLAITVKAIFATCRWLLSQLFPYVPSLPADSNHKPTAIGFCAALGPFPMPVCVCSILLMASLVATYNEPQYNRIGTHTHGGHKTECPGKKITRKAERTIIKKRYCGKKEANHLHLKHTFPPSFPFVSGPGPKINSKLFSRAQNFVDLIKAKRLS